MPKADKVKNKRELGVTSHTYHLSTQEAEAGRLNVFTPGTAQQVLSRQAWTMRHHFKKNKDRNTLILYEFYEEK